MKEKFVLVSEDFTSQSLFINAYILRSLNVGGFDCCFRGTS